MTAVTARQAPGLEPAIDRASRSADRLRITFQRRSADGTRAAARRPQRSRVGQGRRGRWPASRWAPSPTCSTGPTGSAPRTRERVERAMAELGFVRNESARALRAGRSRTLAYVMLDAGNPFFTDVAQGIELAAETADLSLFLCNSDNRAAREETHLAQLQQQRVQGILITPVDPEAPVARRDRPARHARGDRRPDPSGRELLLGRRRRRARRPAGGRAPARPRAHAGSRSWAAPPRSARSATGSRARARPGPRPACPRTTWW